MLTPFLYLRIERPDISTTENGCLAAFTPEIEQWPCQVILLNKINKLINLPMTTLSPAGNDAVLAQLTGLIWKGFQCRETATNDPKRGA